MLRPRPSEITLTAEDVEETMRRIERSTYRLNQPPPRPFETVRRYLGNLPQLRHRNSLDHTSDGAFDAKREKDGQDNSPSEAIEPHPSSVMTPSTDVQPPGEDAGPRTLQNNQSTEMSNAITTADDQTPGMTPSDPPPPSQNANASLSITAIPQSAIDFNQTVSRPIPLIRDHTLPPDGNTSLESHIMADAAREQDPNHLNVATSAELATRNSSSPPFSAQPEEPAQPELTRAHSSLDGHARRVHTRLDAFHERTRSFFGRSKTSHAGQNLRGGIGRSQRNASQQSETSSDSSLPYSLYGVPVSSYSSGTPSQSGPGPQLPNSQYDGAGSFRRIVRGRLLPSRPVEANRRSAVFPAPPLARIESFSLPNLLSAVRGHTLSPRPAAPYSRSEALLTLFAPGDGVGEAQDAVRAAQRGLSSPLEVVMNRGELELSQMPVPQPTSASAEARPGLRRSVTPAGPSHPLVHGGVNMRQESGNSAHRRLMQGAQRPLETRDDNRTPSQSSNIPPRNSSHRRIQRSSENMPVGGTSSSAGRPVSQSSPTQARRVSFATTLQIQPSEGGVVRSRDVAVFPAPVRLAIPQRTHSPRTSVHHNVEPVRNPNNRPQPAPPASPPQQHHSAPSLSMDLPSPPNRHDRRRRRQLSHHHPAVPPVPETTALTMPARPPIPLRLASRPELRGGQLPPQVDQENSGEAEQEMLRRELVNAGMRYGENGAGLEVLDETPPRMGRLERWMEG